MQQLLIGGTIAFLVTLLVIPVIIVVAKEKKLYDEPDESRKIHKRPVPSLGGLGMFVGFILSILLTINFSTEAPEFQYYIAAFFLIFFLGIKDDILVIAPIKKLLGQVLAACILVFKAKLFISNMDGVMGFHHIDPLFSYILSIFSIVVIINAFNLIDGVDGLAGGIGLLSTLVFGTYFMLNGNIAYAMLAFSFSGSLVAFLYYNFNPAKIFMGDTGSLMVGLVNSILVIKFIETAGSYTAYPVVAAPAIGFAILLLPLMDTLRVFAIRIHKGRSPFTPDRNHIHHLLLNRGFDHKKITLTCVAFAASISFIGFYFQGSGSNILLAAIVLLFFAFIYVVSYRKSRSHLRVIKGQAQPLVVDEDIRLVPLFDKKAAVVEEE